MKAILQPRESINFRSVLFAALLLCIPVFVAGCAGKTVVAPATGYGHAQSMGYTIQMGAFKNLDNAVKLTGSIEDRGFDAYYFRHSSGLYKVRFGNFRSFTDAKNKASELKNSGVIDNYYIVPPDSYLAVTGSGQKNLRESLVRTALTYRGIPYQWGGTSAKTGFDCSGLAMAVYRLNGLDLPRTSRQQFRAGSPIPRYRLEKGDLVFFATGRTRQVTHVGIYTGNGRFIHAPGKGKKIRTDKLSEGYYLDSYVGARTYL